MANLQKHFELFHNKIRVSAEPLTEKRDIILDVIRKYLADKGLPGFELINQGSYIYGVGIKPTGENEYDIDVGLAFNIKTADYPDAAVVRKWVLNAVKDHTKKVRDRGPCIRVHYAQGFHVDLVIYAKYTTSFETEDLRLGKKDGSWSKSEPKKLKQYIREAIARFKSTKVEGEATQLQRVVRSLKRWNDLRLEDDSDDKPTGISLLLLAIEKLSPTLDPYSSESDDLTAMTNFCDRVLTSSWDRISVKKPTPEHEDVFSKISDAGMKQLKAAFATMKNALLKAMQSTDVVTAAQELRAIFGDDFPVVEEIKKSELSASLRLDETDLARVAKVEALKTIASGVKDAPKPHGENR